MASAATARDGLQLLREAKPGLEQVTAADVQRVARKYLTEERAWRMVVRPGQ